MEIKKVFILVQIEGIDGLRQVLLDEEKTQQLKFLINAGYFGKDIKVHDKVVAEVEDGTKAKR